jgi:Fe-S-cluster-containing hydrogenase component 2
VTDLFYPLQSLQQGHWFKLICGASFQHLPAVRSLVLAYTLAGADCIDVAADPAVISAAKQALTAVSSLADDARSKGFGYRSLPWLMVSLNDGEDPHFRKAEFNPAYCPADCPQPCRVICPAQAIALQPAPPTQATGLSGGVIRDRCYGCGRCLPVCPIQHIVTYSYVSSPAAVAPLVLQAGVDAIEIHTQVGRFQEFSRLWSAIAPWVDRLKLIAVSCSDGDGMVDYLRTLHDLMAPLPCVLIWQTDGRAMSGDIGAGTTRAAIKLGQKVLSARLPGYVQLAGGTNHHTVAKLRDLGLLNLDRSRTADAPYIAGVAYGSYARTLLAPVLEQLELIEFPASNTDFNSDNGANLDAINQATSQSRSPYLEEVPYLLWQAIALANSLVSQIKTSQPVTYPGVYPGS